MANMTSGLAGAIGAWRERRVPAAEAASAPPSRLEFIDGLRGIAAFIVMAGHALGSVPHMPADHPLYSWRLASWWERLLWPITFGNQMVALFIFVSGFGLYYSEARRRAVKGPMPLGAFFKRRLWRILPVYYVTLLMAMAVLASVPAFQPHGASSIFTPWPMSPEAVAAHLALLHHLRPEWMYRINPPLWSIPVELQLYLAFPLIMLAMTRLRPWLGAAVAVGVYALARQVVDLSFVRFFLEFTVGMLTAHVALSWPRRRSVPLAAAGLAALAWAVSRGPANFETWLWLPGFVGLALACYHLPVGVWNPPTWAPIRRMGLWSYSLYAVHYPLLLLLSLAVAQRGWPERVQAVVMVSAGSAVSLLAAWALYMTVERWSLKRVHAVSGR